MSVAEGGGSSVARAAAHSRHAAFVTGLASFKHEAFRYLGSRTLQALTMIIAEMMIEAACTRCFPWRRSHRGAGLAPAHHSLGAP